MLSGADLPFRLMGRKESADKIGGASSDIESCPLRKARYKQLSPLFFFRTGKVKILYFMEPCLIEGKAYMTTLI